MGLAAGAIAATGAAQTRFEVRFWTTASPITWDANGKPRFIGLFDLTKYRTIDGFFDINDSYLDGGLGLSTTPDNTYGIPAGWSISGLDQTNIVPESGWREITSRVSTLTFGHQKSGKVAVWHADLKGIDFDPAYIQHDLGVIALSRISYHTGTTWSAWSSWTTLFMGWFTGSDKDYDFTEGLPWSARVRGVSYLLDLYQADPVHFGRTNIARGKPVTVSSTASALQIAAQAGSGEFAGATTIVNSANITDGRVPGSPWIADDAPLCGGTFAWQGQTNPQLAITEVYMRAPLGYPDHPAQWIELTNRGTGDFNLKQVDLTIYASCSMTGPRIKFKDVQEDLVIPAGQRAILCQNINRFNEMFSAGQAAFVWEWRQGLTSPNFVLNPLEDFVFISRPTDAGQTDCVRWSTNPSYNPTAPPFDLVSHGWPSWNGNPVSTPRPGSSIERYQTIGGVTYVDYDTNTNGDWHPQPFPTPGRIRLPSVLQYASVDLDAPPCLTDGTQPGGASSLTLTSTFGLRPSGRAIVNGMHFAYQSKTATKLNNVFWFGVTGAVGNGAPVYQVVNGIIQWGWEIGSFTIFRMPGLAHIDEGRIYVTNLVDLAGNEYPNINDPADVDWITSGQWKPFYNIGNPGLINRGSGALSVNVPSDDYYRARHFMILIDQMDYVPGTTTRDLAKINEVEVYASDSITDNAFANAATTIDNAIFYMLVTHFGMPTSKVRYVNFHIPVDDITTSKTSLLSILGDWAENFGAQVIERYDNTISWTRDPWIPGWPNTTVFEWTRDNAARVHVQAGNRHEVGQVKVIANSPDRRSTYEASYPRTASPGRILTVTRAIASDIAGAERMARGHYLQENFSDRATLESKGIANWALAGYLHTIAWDTSTHTLGMPESDDNGYARWIVEAVENQVSFGAAGEYEKSSWRTTLELTRYHTI